MGFTINGVVSLVYIWFDFLQIKYLPQQVFLSSKQST